MSTVGAPTRSDGAARRVRNAGAEQVDTAARSSANTHHRLLWSTGIVAFILGIVAFVLWGINGASILFDMMVALCT